MYIIILNKKKNNDIPWQDIYEFIQNIFNSKSDRTKLNYYDLKIRINYIRYRAEYLVNQQLSAVGSFCWCQQMLIVWQHEAGSWLMFIFALGPGPVVCCFSLVEQNVFLAGKIAGRRLRWFCSMFLLVAQLISVVSGCMYLDFN